MKEVRVFEIGTTGKESGIGASYLYRNEQVFKVSFHVLPLCFWVPG
jgi:hypothetical protein